MRPRRQVPGEKEERMAEDLERADTPADDDPPADAAAASPPDISRLGDLFSGPVELRSLALTGIFILLFFSALYFARAIFLPIVLAFLLTFLLAPAVRGLRRIGIP